MLQAYDTAQFIQLTSGGADIAVLAGDLNTEPGDLAYRIISSIPGLTDAFSEAGESAQHISATNESSKNSYTPENLLQKNIQGKRIDYIMYQADSKLQIKLKSYELPLPNKVPKYNFSYSDHEAVAVTLSITKKEVSLFKYDDETKKVILEDSVEICDEALKSLIKQKYLYWFFFFVLCFLLLTTFTAASPFGFNIVYNILRIIITLFMFYTLTMATFWNKIERHAVIAGRLSMEANLRNLKNTKA